MLEDHLGRQVLIVFILILVNAFFAGAEIAVISLNGNKVRRDAEEGDSSAKKMLKLVDDPTSFLSTIQIAITLAGFLASAFAADTFSDRLVRWLVDDCGWTMSEQALNTICVIVITCILSYFTLVLGELVPKRLAMVKTEMITRITVPVVLGMGVVFRPVVWLLSVSTNGLLRLLGIKSNDGEEQVTETEIRMMVDIGGESGAIEPKEKEMIENIFEFNNITAGDVMVHRKDMTVVWLDDEPSRIIQTIVDSGLSRFPVCGEDIDDVRGILRTREYLLNAHSNQPKPLEALIADPYFVPETVAADVLFRDMQQKKIHMAIVVDEYGGTSGLVTMEDLLEEIVGNIYDEFDQEDEQEITLIGENLWRVSGSADLDTVAEVLDVEFPEDLEVDTIGGLLFSMLNEIPADDEHPEADVCGLHLRAETIADRRVEWAIVSKLPEPTPPEEE